MYQDVRQEGDNTRRWQPSAQPEASTSKAVYRPTPGMLASPENTSESGSEENSPKVESPSQTDVPPKPRPRTRGKPGGRMVALLRESQNSSATPTHISPTGRTARLVNTELTFALTWHLLHLASGDALVPSATPLVELPTSSCNEEVGKERRASSLPDALREVLFACSLALGARRTNHTGILGPAENGDTLGRRRESACRALAQRSVDIAEQHGVLKNTTPEGRKVVSFLRVTLFSASPGNPYAMKLAAASHRHQVLDSRMDGHQQSGLSVLEYEGYLAAQRGRPSTISDFDLEKYYLWDPDEVEQAVERLKNVTAYPPSPSSPSPFATSPAHPPPGTESSPVRDSQIISVSVIRTIVRLQSDLPTPSLSTIKRSFATMFAHVDALHALLASSLQAPTQTHSTTRLTHLASVPLALESNLGSLASKLLRSTPDFAGTGLLTIIQQRYLSSLARFTVLLSRLPIGPTITAQERHNLATMLWTLDILPDWIQLASQAASSQHSGMGPFSQTGFGISQMRTLHRAFEKASDVFAHSSEREEQLRHVIKALETICGPEPKLQEVREHGAAEVAQEEFVAESMVGQALRNMQ